MLSDVLLYYSANRLIGGKAALESKLSNLVGALTFHKAVRLRINNQWVETHRVFIVALEIESLPRHKQDMLVLL